MQPIEREVAWLAAHGFIEQVELEQTCGLLAVEIDELVEYGALVPQPAPGAARRRFNAECLEPLRQAVRLRQDYDLDLFAVSLVLGYLTRIERLEERIRGLHAVLPRVAQVERDGPAAWREPHGTSG
jgi:chaperone modulatory protein CbpM